jgi:hypothetical protein
MLSVYFLYHIPFTKCSRILILKDNTFGVCPGKTALLLVVRVPVDNWNDKIPSVFRTTDGEQLE